MTRREVLAAGGLSVMPLWARRHFDRSRISAITDEIGKTADEAMAFARQYGLHWVELRSVPETRKEYAFLPEAELKGTAAALAANGLKVSFLNTGLMKFPWPGTQPVRRREESAEARARRAAADQARFERRMEDLKRTLNAAHILGVDKVRVFTGSRVADPESLYPRIADILGEMAFVAEKEKIHLLVENEGSCNVATSAELAKFLPLLASRWVGLNWDPQNALPYQEVPYPDGYSLLPKKRILNVQIKAKGVMPSSPERLDWKAILEALDRDGYRGEVGLETHIFDGTLIAAAHISMKEILRIAGEL
ncbi:MAG TPA: sugar phosphate isomerase/epimerase family protein [Bryobacteraceae bacterium]|nr:sugar phosphate isomerase/epimerase family protein [Bryobacteraceae bacterium]